MSETRTTEERLADIEQQIQILTQEATDQIELNREKFKLAADAVKQDADYCEQIAKRIGDIESQSEKIVRETVAKLISSDSALTDALSKVIIATRPANREEIKTGNAVPVRQIARVESETIAASIEQNVVARIDQLVRNSLAKAIEQFKEGGYMYVIPRSLSNPSGRN
jgi:hypothetical protein